MKRSSLTRFAFMGGSAAMALLCGACGEEGSGGDRASKELSQAALSAAEYAQREYRGQIIDSLAQLVSFQTVHRSGTPNQEHPEFLKMTAFLKDKAAELGLDFQDHGAVVVIGLGQSKDKLGLVTHGDVQPADASKWPSGGPFRMDRESEPGRLIGRGTEDDKGPIAIALYAMKALADKGFPLTRRIELIISYTEESDWNPMIAFLRDYDAPQLNIVLDSKYPVVSAEKGYCVIRLALPLAKAVPEEWRPFLSSFSGGSFVSQVPEDARALIRNAGGDLKGRLEQMAALDTEVEYRFELIGDELAVSALGKSAHSSEPEAGVNAITHLAALLGQAGLGRGTSGLYVDFINEYVGTGYYAEKFGDIAYSHAFMGPLTLSLSTLEEKDGKHILSINLRRPAGKSRGRLEEEIRRLIEDWKMKDRLPELTLELSVGDPHLIEDAPHVPVLLGVFSHYTGMENPEAISAGGGTHARLLPNGVSFGPHMPGRPYTGHTEHEYLSLAELDLDIQMYTAMLVELAARK